MKEVHNETARIAAEAVRASEAEIRLRQDQQIADKKTQQLIMVYQELDAHLDATKRVVYPTLMARFLKFLKRTCGMAIFTEQDLVAISNLERAAARLVELFDASDPLQPSIGSMRQRSRA